MPGVGMQELCCLFCCPPLPSRIAAKLAFLPPQPTYYFVKTEPEECPTTVENQNGDDHAQLIPPPRPTAPPRLTSLVKEGVSDPLPLTVANGDTPAAPVKETSGQFVEAPTKPNPKSSGAKTFDKFLRSGTALFSSRTPGDSGACPFPTLGIHLTQRAEWQYSAKELDRLEACTAVTSRGHVIPCLMVRCGPPQASGSVNALATHVESRPLNSADAPTVPDVAGGADCSPFARKGREASLDGKRASPPSPSKSKKGTKPDSNPLAAVVMNSSRTRTTYAPTKYTILFGHGNAVDLGQMSSFYLGLGSRLGCDVFGYDYTGYGASTSLKHGGSRGNLQNGGLHHNGANGGNSSARRRVRPSEADLYTDAEAAWRALTLKFKVPHDRIILYGQSIGTVPTIHLAAMLDSTEPPAGVVLHSPLTSGLRVAFPFVVSSGHGANGPARNGIDPQRGRRPKPAGGGTGGDGIKSESAPPGAVINLDSDFESPRGVLGCLDAFATMDKVRLIIRSPTLVIHGTDDEVIDHSHGRAIHANLPRPVDPLWVRGAGHNDIELHSEFLVRLKKFIREELNPPRDPAVSASTTKVVGSR